MTVSVELRTIAALDGEKDEAFEKGEGELKLCDDGYEVCYYVEQEPGIRVPFILRKKNSSFYVKRDGIFSSAMTFSSGRRTKCRVRIPEGELTMEVRTSMLEFEQTGEDRKVSIAYELFCEEEIISEYNVTLTIKKIG